MGLFSSQISTRSMVPLCRQMATADEAGIPIIRTLELVGSQTKDPKIKDVLTQINVAIRNGSTLTDAARAQSKYLPRFFIELLATGEHGGRLDIMLRELADYYEDRQAIQRRMLSALVWPMFELSGAWFLGTFAFMTISRALAMFGGRGGQNFDFEQLIKDYAILQGKAGLVVVAAVAVAVILSRLGVFKYVWGLFATYIWPLSPMTRGFAMARFFRSFALLMGAGVHIVKSIENAAAVVVNPYIEKDLLQAIPFVRNGTTLYEAFSVCKFIPRMNLEMVHVGETSGNLEGSLKKAAEYNLEKARHASQRLITVLGMAIFLTVAIICGGLVIMFYMKLYGGMLDGIENL